MQPSMLEAASSHVIKPSVYSSSCSGLTLAIRLYHTVHSSLTFETAETAYAHICRRYCERVRALPRACTGVGMCGSGMCGRVRACAGVCRHLRVLLWALQELLRECAGAVMGMYGHCYGRVPVGVLTGDCGHYCGRVQVFMGAVVGMCGSYRESTRALLWACAGTVTGGA
jgi:hypothetical protein